MLWKNPFWKNIKVCEKTPLAAIFFPLCKDMNQTKMCHCPPPPPLKTHQASFLQVIWCPHRVESNHALRRREPVGQAPKLFKPPKNAALKCRPLNPESRLCFRRLLHLVVMKTYSWLWFLFVCDWINYLVSAIFYQCFKLKSSGKINFLKTVTKIITLLNFFFVAVRPFCAPW